jgi:poly(3-hydroxyalkanoate) synthetase
LRSHKRNQGEETSQSVKPGHLQTVENQEELAEYQKWPWNDTMESRTQHLAPSQQRRRAY